jgi:putative SOS response-associated peptidase YedK
MRKFAESLGIDYPRGFSGTGRARSAGKPTTDGGELIAPRYNICPSQPVIVILNDGKLEVTRAKWGLIPSWARAEPMGSARRSPDAGREAEGRAAGGIRSEYNRPITPIAKPSFRGPFKRRRCLVLADGFYEWKQTKPKQPFYFRLKSKAVFAFAGLWDLWRDPAGEEVLTCCLITTTPNALLEKVHHRMPVILQPQYYDLWLSEAEQQREELEKVLVPYPTEEMEGYPVSTLVNKPQNDVPDCIQPLA